jgi:hypothetical protein
VQDNLLGGTIGLGIGLACIFYGLQGKAQSVLIHHPGASGPVAVVSANLVPFPGMEWYQLEAQCSSEEDCQRLERRLDQLGYQRE